MKLLIIMTALLMSAPAYAAQMCQPATTQQVDDVRTVLKSRIQDADSSRLIDVCAVKRGSNNTGSICGLVNSKNKHAAYSGFKPFVANVSRSQITIVENARLASDEKAKYCRECDSPVYCR